MNTDVDELIKAEKTKESSEQEVRLKLIKRVALIVLFVLVVGVIYFAWLKEANILSFSGFILTFLAYWFLTEKIEFYISKVKNESIPKTVGLKLLKLLVFIIFLQITLSFLDIESFLNK